MRLGPLLVTVAACSGDAPDLVVAPDWDDRAPVPRTVLGHNTVWSRDGLGIWDEAAGDVDAAAWPHVEALAPGALRFPGGTRGLRWHFAGTIGPVADRVAQCDTFRGEVDATTYGLGEMLAVASRAGAPVTLMTPLSDGTPEEAAAMLAYASTAPDSAAPIGVDRAGVDWQTAGAWAARRDADGVPPAEVLLVEVGNEPYLDLPVGPTTSCGRAGRFRQDERWEGDVEIPITAADYAAQVTLHAAALRAVAPDVLVGAAAMSDFASDDAATAVAPNDRGGGDAWNPRLVADADFDAWILHPYDFSAADDRVLLAERARTVARGLLALGGSKRVAVTEFGTLFDADTMLNALLSADFVRVAVEEQWLVVTRHILIEDDPAEPFAQSAAILGPAHDRTPGWSAMHLLATNLESEAAAVAPPADDLAVLATIASGGDAVTVVLIDRRGRAGDPVRTVELALPPGVWTGTAWRLSAVGLTSRDVTLDEVAVTGARVEVPPTSITVVRFTPDR